MDINMRKVNEDIIRYEDGITVILTYIPTGTKGIGDATKYSRAKSLALKDLRLQMENQQNG